MVRFSKWLVKQDWFPRLSTATSSVTQRVAAAHRAAQPPWVPRNLVETEHFKASLVKQASCTPLRLRSPASLSLIAVTTSVDARQVRVREPARRWQPVTDRFRLSQSPESPEVRAASAGRHIGLIFLLLVILLRWQTLHSLEISCRASRQSAARPPCRVFACQPSTLWSTEDVLPEGPEDCDKPLKTLRPGPHDDVLVQAGSSSSSKAMERSVSLMTPSSMDRASFLPTGTSLTSVRAPSLQLMFASSCCRYAVGRSPQLIGRRGASPGKQVYRGLLVPNSRRGRFRPYFGH